MTKIEAIKVIKNVTGLGLVESKDLYERVADISDEYGNEFLVIPVITAGAILVAQNDEKRLLDLARLHQNRFYYELLILIRGL